MCNQKIKNIDINYKFKPLNLMSLNMTLFIFPEGLSIGDAMWLIFYWFYFYWAFYQVLIKNDRYKRWPALYIGWPKFIWKAWRTYDPWFNEPVDWFDVRQYIIHFPIGLWGLGSYILMFFVFTPLASLAHWTGEYDPIIAEAYRNVDNMDDEIKGYMVRLFPIIDDWLAGPYSDFNPIVWRLLIDVVIKTMIPYLFIYVLVVLWAHGWPEYDSKTWFRLQNRRYWGGKKM